VDNIVSLGVGHYTYNGESYDDEKKE